MHFVKSGNLKNGMRLAKCLFDKKGAIVFDRDYKLDDRLMDFIKTNGILGIFVLDPTEPLPPQSDDDVEFERTKYLKARDLGEEIKEIVATHRLHKLDKIADDIIERFGTNPRMRIDFSPDARSKDKNLFLIIFSPFFENNIVVCHKSYENFYENQYRAFCTVIQANNV